jgi:hypothetical protein
MGIWDKIKQMSRKQVAITILILIIVGIAGWLATMYLMPSRPKPLMVDMAGRENNDLPSQFSEIKIPVTIFYPAPGGMIKVEKTVAAGSLPVKMVESLLQEFFKGLKNELKSTVVRGVYRDRNRVFYIDLSDEFRRNFSGDAWTEYYLLKSMYQTIAGNVSEVKDVRIIVEGREIESIGGHMIISGSLRDAVSY